MKSRIFAKTNLQRDELLLFEKLFDIMLASLPAPDLLVYLHSDIKRLQSNIRKRGRDYEQNIKDSYLESIQEAYFDYLKKQNKSAVLIIDITNVDFVDDLDIYNEVKRLISMKYTIGSTDKIIL
jgi:deoxyadenosine/deoxycytidine kinase